MRLSSTVRTTSHVVRSARKHIRMFSNLALTSVGFISKGRNRRKLGITNNMRAAIVSAAALALLFCSAQLPAVAADGLNLPIVKGCARLPCPSVRPVHGLC
jgi:hypothetical protein